MMAQSNQRIIWTALPNGVADGRLRLSVFVAPQITLPAGTSLPLDKEHFPYFVDWAATVKSGVAFKVEFEDVGTFDEGLTDPAQAPSPHRIRRVTPRPLKHVKHPWQEVFATSPDAKLTPVVRSFKQGPRTRSDVAVVPFMTREVLQVVNNQYAALLGSSMRASVSEPQPLAPQIATPRATPPPPPEVHATPQGISRGSRTFFDSLREQLAGPGQLKSMVAEMSKRVEDGGRNPLATDATTASTNDVPDARKLAAAFLYHLSLEPPPQTPRDGSPGIGLMSHQSFDGSAGAGKQEIEFHQTLAAVGSHPILLRHLGLVIDLEIPISAELSTGWRGRRVRVKPVWLFPQASRVEDVTPWTEYKLSGGLFQAAPRETNSDLYNGLLNLTARDPADGKPRFQLEQIDALNEALKLIGYVLNVEKVAPDPSEVFSSPRGGGLALIRNGLHERLRARLKMAEQLEVKIDSRDAQLTLFAEDLTRGYRMDIGQDGRWLSLSRRRGTYNFLAKGVTERVGGEEGWVATSAVRSAAPAGGKERIAVHDTVCKWEGWSLAAPRPGKPIESNTLSDQNGSRGPLEENVTFTTDLQAEPRSLPALRYGRHYSVRVRVADLAGNSVAPDDPTGVDPHVIAGPIPYLRFDPVPAPDVVPLAAPDGGHGESVFTLVIRSNYDTPCTEVAERHLAPPKASELLAEMHGYLDDKGRPDEDAYSMLVKYDGEAPQIEPDKKYQVPYLPDPLAVGAHFHSLPGAAAGPFPIDFSLGKEKWPRVKPWRLRVVEDPEAVIPADDAPPQFRPPEYGGKKDAGVLTVYLPKAEVMTVPLNSILTKTDLGLMALWDFVRRSYPQISDVFEEHILKAWHWMFNPMRELRLVHAVRQPLFPPKFQADSKQPPPSDYTCPAAAADTERINVGKRAGDTFATLTASMKMPGRSARSYEVFGAWTEFLDEGETFRQEPGRSVAFADDLEQRDYFLCLRGRHEFGDTKHRLVTYVVSAKTRFREFLKIEDAEIVSGAKPITRESVKVTVHVPNSAVPPPPAVLYTIPTFGWFPQRRESVAVGRPVTVSRARGGGGLRVYLDRPWYKTGEGELLGVVVASGGSPAPMDTHVSRWGRDPLSKLPGPGRPLAAADFKGEIKAQGTYRWEVAGGEVTVLGYPVGFDPERRLWFSDIEIDPGASYFPFVRLALTRFQPYSVGPTEEAPTNLFLSPVVLSDFCQLAPERHASVVIDTAGPGHLMRIRLAGKAQVSTNNVAVTVERGNQDYEGEIRWEQATKPQALALREDAAGPYWLLDDLSIPFGAGPLRVLFTESEEHDEDRVGDPANTSQRAARIVYAGVVYL